MKTILFTNARNESHILEWVLHHLKLGFDYIYIIDHKSTEPIYKYLKTKHSPEQNLSKVNVFRLNRDIIKINLMKIALNIAVKKNFDWMLYIDCDEYLVLNNTNNINVFLKKYNNFDQVAFNWLMFGSNYRNELLPPSESIITTYTRSEEYLNKHVKCAINLKSPRFNIRNINIVNPHFYQFRNMNFSVNTLLTKLNPREPYFLRPHVNFDKIPAFLAHYSTQSYNDYINRKILIPRDDSGTHRERLSKEELHKKYNNVINNWVKNKYEKIE